MALFIYKRSFITRSVKDPSLSTPVFTITLSVYTSGVQGLGRFVSGSVLCDLLNNTRPTIIAVVLECKICAPVKLKHSKSAHATPVRQSCTYTNLCTNKYIIINDFMRRFFFFFRSIPSVDCIINKFRPCCVVRWSLIVIKYSAD